MNRSLETRIKTRASTYAGFSGVLIGFSIAIVVFIIALANDEVANSPQYLYSLSAFVYSALAFFNSYTWFERAEEQSEKQWWHFLFGAFFYYTAYWGLLLGLVYLTSLIKLQSLNYPFLISLMFLGYTFTINLYEFACEIYDKDKDTKYGIIFLVLFIMVLIISFLTIPKEPVEVLLRMLNPF
jgi:uncharacterized membrane protein